MAEPAIEQQAELPGNQGVHQSNVTSMTEQGDKAIKPCDLGITNVEVVDSLVAASNANVGAVSAQSIPDDGNPGVNPLLVVPTNDYPGVENGTDGLIAEQPQSENVVVSSGCTLPLADVISENVNDGHAPDAAVSLSGESCSNSKPSEACTTESKDGEHLLAHCDTLGAVASCDSYGECLSPAVHAVVDVAPHSSKLPENDSAWNLFHKEDFMVSSADDDIICLSPVRTPALDSNGDDGGVSSTEEPISGSTGDMSLSENNAGSPAIVHMHIPDSHRSDRDVSSEDVAGFQVPASARPGSSRGVSFSEDGAGSAALVHVHASPRPQGDGDVSSSERSAGSPSPVSAHTSASPGGNEAASSSAAGCASHPAPAHVDFPSGPGDDGAPPSCGSVDELHLAAGSNSAIDNEAAGFHEGKDYVQIESPLQSSSVAEAISTIKEDMDILGNGKLIKKVVKVGRGIHTRPQYGSQVTIRCQGLLPDGSVIDQFSDMSFILHDGDVIAAIDLAVALMEEGEECELHTAADYAYKGIGRHPDVPPECPITYKLELLSVRDPPVISELSIEEVIALGDKKRERGNYLYSRTEYESAIVCYTRAVQITDDPGVQSGNTHKLQELLDLRLKCYNNLAATHVKVKHYDAAIESCDKVLKLQPANVKALFRKGKSFAAMGSTKEAIDILKEALKLEPGTKVIHRELYKLQERLKKDVEDEKNLYKKMLGQNDADGSQASKQSFSKMTTYGIIGAIAAAAVSVGVLMFRKYL